MRRFEEGGGAVAPLLPSLTTDAMPAGGRSRTAPRRFLLDALRLPRWTLPAVGGVLLSIAAVAGIALGPDMTDRPGAPPPGAVEDTASGTLYRNPEAGFSFRHPARWQVRGAGTATTVRAPGNHAMITFGIGARGRVHDAERTLLAGIRRSYKEVRLTALQVAPIAGRPAVTVAGTGVNDRRVPIRFLAVTVGGPGRNYSITMFTAAGETGLMPRLQGILDSFRVTG
jgi:hypothetical protein